MRTPIVGWTIVLVLASSPPARSLTLEDLVRAYQQKYVKITTLRYDASLSSEPVVSEEDLFRYHRRLPALPETVRVVAHRDGRTFHESSELWGPLFDPFTKLLAREFPAVRGNFNAMFELPYDRVRAAVDRAAKEHTEKSLKIVLFDGQKIWEHRPDEEFATDGAKRRAFTVVDPARIDRQFVPGTLLDDMLYGFDIAPFRRESEHRRRNRVPEVFEGGEFRLREGDESGWVVAEAPGKERIYFDPALQFAVRKRQWFMDGKVCFEFEGRDYEQLADGIWLPRDAVETAYGTKLSRHPACLGKPLFHNRFKVERLELNRPEHLALLAADVPAGAWVVD